MSSKKGVLGKGLNALLPSQEEQEKQDADAAASKEGVSKSRLYQFENEDRLVGHVTEVEVANVRPNPYQPRQEFNEDALDELAASIDELGVIQPITVRALGEGQFEIISGERRLRAARRAGLETLPAYVREADSEAMLEMALVENVQREELNPIEVALGYQRLIDECDLTQAEVAKKVSKGRATVANFLRLLKLPPRVQAGLRDKSLSVGHARALINVDDEEAQTRILKEIEEEDLTVRQVEERVRAWRNSKEEAESKSDDTPAEEATSEAQSAPDRTDLQLNAFRDKLRSHFSTQVRVKHKADGEGHIKISYYSEEDLERLMELLLA